MNGCLVAACITDIKSNRVYNMVWWIFCTAAITLFVIGGVLPDRHQFMGLLFYVFLQMALFSKMYGKADCYAFISCALAGMGWGWAIRDFLVHMFLAFSILTMVQIKNGNVNSRGNLKTPVPFIPYITLAFWAMLWYHIIC